MTDAQPRQPYLDADIGRAWAILERAYGDTEAFTRAHLFAVAALLDADHGLPYHDLTREVNRSLRQTKRVIRDLEREGVIERDAPPAGVHEDHRFTLAGGDTDGKP